ncbi:porin family protein [Coprobacter tertius]|uniref:PorT family protein n=1 Tax=Coprobacter tertius TaxID=2944915 RepID=A0ABT1MGT3_9BACT|nr:porin family protein [Coprobacter tertius]MCP9611854.1 PorT family protein [Coprobacter tertius]
MKKNLLACLLLVMGSVLSPLSAQYQKEISVGAKFGTNLSRATFRPSVKQNLLLGYMGGISFRYSEEKYFGFIIEANFSQQGWDENFEDPSLKYNRRMNYLEVPFMTHIFFGNKVIRGFVNLGPQVGFLISDKKNTNLDLNNLPKLPSDSHPTEQLNMPIAKKFDYGICGGAGIELRAKKHSFMLEGRYCFGLGDFFNNRKKDYFATSSNQNITIALTYMFRLK